MSSKRNGSIRQYVYAYLVVIAVVTGLIGAGFVATAGSHDYSSVRRTLESQVQRDMVEAYFNMVTGGNGDAFGDAALEYVRSFDSKGKMEVWVLGNDGRVVASSSGFAIPLGNAMPDHAEAMSSPGGRGVWVGRYHGEPVYAFTCRLDLASSKYYAIRYLVSLRDINLQIFEVGLLCAAVWLLLVLLQTVAARLLVRWVVNPVARISQAAAKIAQGDYEIRIPLPKTRNELYSLCEDINDMAVNVAFAEKTKLDFISTISHELRTPLTAIKGWGETLQQDESDAALTRRGLGVITEESVRLTRLVEELLDFSRIQNNALTLNKEPIDVLAELDDVVFFFRERAARDGVALVSNTSELPAPMLGDPARVRQVFINLLDNSFKHTPQGGSITVDSDFTPVHAPDTLHVTIRDTGCGVSAGDLPHITEKFFKSSTATKGSGIGLAVVAELLKAHGCTLAFESELDQGLTVKIAFPLMRGNTK